MGMAVASLRADSPLAAAGNRSVKDVQALAVEA